MKVYQYNGATGLFEGEIYAESGTLQYLNSITTVAPPEHGTGVVPVFDVTTQRWELVPHMIARQLVLGRDQ